MARRLRGHIACRAGSTTSLDDVRFGVIGEDRLGGVPLTTDFDDESKNLWEQRCTVSRDTVNNLDWNAAFHFDLSLSLRLPLDQIHYFSVLNEGDVTNFFSFVARLFWSLI